MEEQVIGELAPHEFLEERLESSVAASGFFLRGNRTVPADVRRELSKVQVRRETGGAFDSWKIAAVRIPTKSALQKRVEAGVSPLLAGLPGLTHSASPIRLCGKQLPVCEFVAGDFFAEAGDRLWGRKGCGRRAECGERAPERRVDLEGVAGFGAHVFRFAQHRTGKAFDGDAGAGGETSPYALFLSTGPGFVGAREVERGGAGFGGDRCQFVFRVAAAEHKGRAHIRK